MFEPLYAVRICVVHHQTRPIMQQAPTETAGACCASRNHGHYFGNGERPWIENDAALPAAPVSGCPPPTNNV